MKDEQDKEIKKIKEKKNVEIKEIHDMMSIFEEKMADEENKFKN